MNVHEFSATEMQQNPDTVLRLIDSTKFIVRIWANYDMQVFVS